MPVVPVFDEDYQVPAAPAQPRADPQAMAQPGIALEQAGGQVASEYDRWSQQYAEARRASDAAAINADASAKLADMQFRYSKVPDNLQALSGFNAEAAQLRKQTLAGINDPLVASHFTQQFDQNAMIAASDTRRAAFGLEASSRTAGVQERLTGYANQLAGATSPQMTAHVLDQMDADLAGNAAATWIRPAEVPTLRSGALRSAIMLKSDTDPIGAYAMMQQYGSRLTTEDTSYLALRLKYGLARAQGGALAREALADASAPAGNFRDMVTSEARGAGVDPALALAVTGVESDFGRTASDSPQSQYVGPFRLGAELRAKYGLPAKTQADLTSEIRGGVAALKDEIPIANQAVGGTAAPWQVYTVHQQGAAGGPALLTADPATNAVDALTPAYGGNRQAATNAVVQNGGRADMTAGAFLGTIQSMFERNAGRVAGGAPFPDEQELARRILAKTDDPMVQDEGLAALSTQMSHLRIQTASDRERLNKQLPDLQQALEAGSDLPIPENDIRSVMPPQQANDTIARLQMAKTAGRVFSSVQWGSPDDIAQARADLQSGLGPISALLRAHTRAAAGNATPGTSADTADQFVLRQQIAGRLDELVTRRNAALAADPAGYVAGNPTVQDAMKSVDPAKPGTMEAYAQASLGAQAHMGVPEASRHILTAGQAAGVVKQLMTADPGKTDIGQTLDATEQSYGSYWPQVFGDLVSLGKMPREFQMVAAMDAPAQAAARADLARAIQATAQRGGMKALRDDIAPDDARTIDQGINDSLADFRRTAMIPGANSNVQLMTGVADTVKQLAYFYTLQGKSGADALNAAVDGILNQKYDFNGTQRVPKGMASLAASAAASRQAQLQASDLAPVPGNPDLTSDQRAEIVANTARRRGQWYPNERDDGLVLMAPLRDGSNVPVMLKDGSRVELKFRDMQAPTAAPLPAEPTLGGP